MILSGSTTTGETTSVAKPLDRTSLQLCWELCGFSTDYNCSEQYSIFNAGKPIKKFVLLLKVKLRNFSEL